MPERQPATLFQPAQNDPDAMLCVTQESSSHNYFTMIPNTVLCGETGKRLSVYAHRLYGYLASQAWKPNGKTLSTKELAEETGMSGGMISSAKQELAKEALVTITKGNPARHIPDTICLRDIWTRNMQEFSPEKRLHSMNADQVFSQEAPSLHERDHQNRVHHMNASLRKKEELKKELKEDISPLQGVVDVQPKKPIRKTRMPETPEAQESLKTTVFTDKLTEWVISKGLTFDLNEQWECFVSKAIAKGYQYVNWHEAFKCWLKSPYQSPVPGQPKNNKVLSLFPSVPNDPTSDQLAANFVAEMEARLAEKAAQRARA